MFSFYSKTLVKVSVGLFLAISSSQAHASQSKELSLLKENNSFRSKFATQPNINKGEFTVQAQVPMIYILEQSLPAFLSQVAVKNKLKLTLSNQVSGVLKKISYPMKPELILADLEKSHGIQWHFESDHLFVSNGLENTNRLISLGDVNFIKLKKVIKNSGFKPGANKMSFKEDENAVLMIGSKQYIAIVEKIIKSEQAKITKKKQS